MGPIQLQHSKAVYHADNHLTTCNHQKDNMHWFWGLSFIFRHVIRNYKSEQGKTLKLFDSSVQCVFFAVCFACSNYRVIISAFNCFVCKPKRYPAKILLCFLFLHNTNVLLDVNNIPQDEIDILIPTLGWQVDQKMSLRVPILSFILSCALHFPRKENISSRI